MPTSEVGRPFVCPLMLTPDEVKPLVDFDWGVSPFSGDSDHFWREHPPNGTGLLLRGQH